MKSNKTINISETDFVPPSLTIFPSIILIMCLSMTEVYGGTSLGQIVDSGTQRNNMHACPPGYFVIGVHVGNNKLLCSNTLQILRGEYVEKNNTYSGGVKMRSCQEGYVVTGLHVGKNQLSCAPIKNKIPYQVDTRTQSHGMHACPGNSPVAGIHVGKNLLLCGTHNSQIASKPRMKLPFEEMTDRCSGDVIIVPRYDASKNIPTGLYLKRDSVESTKLSERLRVDGRRIRWYCHSTSALPWLDPGTWRIKDGAVIGGKCDYNSDGVSNCKPSSEGWPLTTSAQDGWYPERSRCKRTPKYIRARLGPSRLLRINCYE